MQTLNHMTPRDHRLHTDELRRAAGLRRWAMQARTLHLHCPHSGRGAVLHRSECGLRGAGA